MSTPDSELPLEDDLFTGGDARSHSPSATSDAVSAPDPDTDIAGLSYEQARDELVRVVSALEQGGATLEESLQLWERGEALAARCEQWLIGARARLDAVRGGSTAG